MQLWSRPAVTEPIVLNEQAIVDNLTEDNLTSIFASRRTWDDEQVYLVHDQGIAGIGPPLYTLVVKKFQNKNPALQVDESVRNRCNSELNLLANIRHDNIIKVVDLIQREDAIMLVYEYPVNGSLQSWLHQPMDAGQPLTWPKRSIIATGVAQGLCHLHHGCNNLVVHHNISPNNILLDQTFKPVIAGFDAAQMYMAGLGQPLPITDLPPGNFGYAAPEYGNTASPMTEKVDTYSFGMLLLVLVTGRECSGAGADGHLVVWARNFTELMENQPEIFEGAVDMVIPDQARYMEEMATVFRLGVDCTAVDPKQRPSMQLALKQLHRGCGRGPFRGLLTCYLP